MFSDKGLWIGAALLFAELVIVVFIVNPNVVEKTIIEEQRTVAGLFGQSISEKAKSWALRNFEAHFIETGILPFLSRMYSRTAIERERSTGMESMGRRFEAWTAIRIEALHQSLYGVYHRAYLIGVMLTMSAALIVAGIIDALFQRQIQFVNYETSNAVFYHGAKRGLVWLAIIPLLVLFAPIKVSAFWFVLWGLVIPVLIWIGARNVQELA